METLNKTKIGICEDCHNTGIKTVANGEDDFDHAFCECTYGNRARNGINAFNAVKEQHDFIFDSILKS